MQMGPVGPTMPPPPPRHCLEEEDAPAGEKKARLSPRRAHWINFARSHTHSRYSQWNLCECIQLFKIIKLFIIIVVVFFLVNIVYTNYASVGPHFDAVEDAASNHQNATTNRTRSLRA